MRSAWSASARGAGPWGGRRSSALGGGRGNAPTRGREQDSGGRAPRGGAPDSTSSNGTSAPAAVSSASRPAASSAKARSAACSVWDLIAAHRSTVAGAGPLGGSRRAGAVDVEPARPVGAHRLDDGQQVAALV